MQNPLRLIIIAFALLIIGVALPFLIVIGVLTNILPLNVIAYVCAVGGFIAGFVGIAQYRRRDK